MVWYKERSVQLKDFIRFSHIVIRSGDIDPQFPILKHLYKQLKLDTNTALWYTALYLVFYHIGSATEAWKKYPKPDIIRSKDWFKNINYSKQRRCFRGNDGGLKQLNALVKNSDGDLQHWVEDLVGSGGKEGWTRVRMVATELPYHGPWSSYKFCDMMKFIHDYPITAPDIGTKPGATAGPIAGLVSLTGLDRQQCSEDTQLHLDLLRLMKDEGVDVDGLDQMESCLCDWQSIINGRYYLGHDVDRDLGQIQTDNNYWKQISEIRRDIFDERLLGELNNWSGIRNDLNGVYKGRRRLINYHPDIKKVTMRERRENQS